ncbi:MAG: carboxylate--amine ligase [Thermoleophilaceae bacterium]
MNARSPAALVLGDDYRALGIARCLGRRGIPVWMLAARRAGPTQFSRYCQRLAWLSDSEEAHVSTLLEVGARSELAGAVVFPTEDTDAEMLARHYDRLSTRLRLTVPRLDVVLRALDKRLAAEAAQAAGVHTPRTYRIESAADLDRLDLRFPLILKPAVKEEPNELTRRRAWRVDSPQQLRERFARASELVGAEAVVVQQLLPGGGETQFSYAALCDDGVPLAEIVARRVRQYPIDFGRSSSYVEVIEAAEVKRAATRLLAELRYSGLVEVELKRDLSSGRLALLDVNPRLWTWHMLGTHAGVDFPYLAWLRFSGRPVPPTSARVGARWMRMSTDALAAITEIRRGRLSARTYLDSLAQPKEGAVFARDDPMPALVDLLLLGRRFAHTNLATLRVSR